MKRYFESEEIIRDQLIRRNDDPELWLLLSNIQKASKNISQTERYKQTTH